MHAVIPFLLRHGYWVLVANVFAEQLGLPVPAFPVLLAMGALAGLGYRSFDISLVLAVCAAMLSDVIWFRLGRVRGRSILNLLCRLSLEPDTCVSNTKGLFSRFGAPSLLFAKFVPGLGAAAAPLAGLTRMPAWKFLSADAAGAVIWSAAYLGAGFIFRDQLEDVAEYLRRMGSGLLLVLIGLLAAYIAWKYYQRQRFIRDLRVARVTPEELREMLQARGDVVIVDLRRALEVQYDRVKLPGALWIALEDLERRHEEIPRDKEVVLYCS
ncbi:MAG TPA: VTT domain-containing protein [Candidatus Sulfopaludibacter sp.]|nr:VTT domain-containing protein [Candidatus Sulfopaludibacter sp.]